MRFYFESYGCTMNKGEAIIMQDILKENGHNIVNEIEFSDALVLVTCTVIETTELKMMKRIRELSKTKKPVIVAGCMASVQKDKILAQNPSAELVTPQEIWNIGKIINSMVKEVPTGKGDHPVTQTAPRKAADVIIPIASGCLGHCTYCITQIARGKLKSTPPEILMESIKKALSEGNKEIRLTSQDNAAYGMDIQTNFPWLLNKIQALDGEFRVRIGMMNPDNVTPILPEIINAYEDPRIYKFLHLPVQSGSERMLDLMGREYSINDFQNSINSFRSIFPNITISTDVIVGFPKETEEDFQKTVQFIETLKPDILNITRFSPRPKTKAIDMDNKVPGRIAKERSRILSKIHSDISRNINKTFVGKKERILVTEHGKSGTMMGRTDAYKTVVVEDDVNLCEFVDVKIEKATEIYLKGRIIK